MSLNLKSSGGGSVTVDVPSTASNYTATIQAADGTLSPLVSGTAVASTSGTSIDFTSIPSWVKRITVMFNAVSFAAAGVAVIQIGSGSLTTSGYNSLASGFANLGSGSVATFSNGAFFVATSSAASTFNSVCVLTLLTGNTWVSTFTTSRPADLIGQFGNGVIALSGTLDRLSVVATTSTFDAGSINILYE